MVDRLVQDRAVEPHDVLVVVLDFWPFGVVIVCFRLMRSEMAVRDGVFVPGLVNVCRRERRRERQEGRDETSRRGASQGTANHRLNY